MSEMRTEDEKKTEGCKSCGDDRVMLTEERNAVPRCAGCGKSLGQTKKQ